MKINIGEKISKRMIAIFMVCMMIFTMLPIGMFGAPLLEVKAEVTTGTISGVISGGNLGVTVELINSSSALVQTMTAATNGAYSFTGVVYGEYTISASKLGYKVESKAVNISNSISVAVDLTLHVTDDYTVTGTAGVENWYTSEVTLKAKSGKQIWNGIEWSDKYIVSTEGEDQKVVIKLKNGGTESVANVLISIDKVSPTVSEPIADFDNTVWKTSKKVSFTASDLIKLDRVYWSNEDNATAGTDLTITSTPGSYQFNVAEKGKYYVYAVDEAGNTTKKSIDIDNVDSEKPTIKNVTKSKNAEWSNVAETVTFEVADAGCGIEKVMYGTSAVSSEATGVAKLKDEKDGKYDFTTPTTEFNGTYYIWAYDKLGNISDVKKVIMNTDTTLPTIKPEDIVFSDKGGLLTKIGSFITFGYFSKSDVTVTITASDVAGLGGEVASISYFTAKDKAGAQPTSDKEMTKNVGVKSKNEVSFTLKPDFEGYVLATAKDKAGNEMVTPIGSSNGLMIENNNINKPEIKITPGATTGPFNGWFNEQVNIKFDVKNVKAGIAKINYTIKNDHDTTNQVEEEVILTNSSTTTLPTSWDPAVILLNKDGKNLVTVKVTDNAGNYKEESTTVNIDKKTPVKPTVTTEYDSKIWTRKDVVYTITEGTPTTDSRVLKYQYKVWDKIGTTMIQDWTDVTEGNETIKNQVTIKDKGHKNIQFRTVSKAAINGVETEKYTVQVDIGKPLDPTATIDTVQIDNNKWYSADAKTVVLNVAQEVDRAENYISYKLDGGEWIKGKDVKPVNVTVSGDKNHSLVVMTENTAGNKSDEKTYNINIEKTLPTINENDIVYKPIDQPKLSRIGNFLSFGYFFKEKVNVTIKAYDPGEVTSGVESISYYTAKTKDALGTFIKDVPLVSNAITFELPIGFEGYVFAIAKDKAGNVMGSPTVSDFSLMLENVKPNIIITPSAKTGSLNNGWYNGQVNINLNVKEDKSGISKIVYKIGSQAQVEETITNSNPLPLAPAVDIPLVWNKDITWSEEDGKDLPVWIEVTDNAGNVETVDTKVNIDTNKPGELDVKTSYGNNTWTKQDVLYTINGESTVSKILRYEYKVLDENSKIVTDWTTVSEGTEALKNQVTIKREGKNNVQFRSVSYAEVNGTENATDKYIALIDKVKPLNPNVSIDGAGLSNDRWYSATDKTVVLAIAQEDDRATNNTWYKLDNGEWIQGASVVISGDLSHSLVVKTVDIAGNTSKEIEYKVNIDNTLPILTNGNISFHKKNTGSFERFMNFASFGHFFNEKISATITATDATSGVAAITYYATQEDKTTKIITDTKVNNSSSNKTSQSVTFDINSNFKGYVFAKVVDVGGNEIPDFVTSDGVIIEDKNKEPSAANIEIVPITKPNANGFYKGDVEVSLKVSDNYSGINKIKYTVGSGEEKTYTAPNTSKDYLTKTWQQNVTVQAPENNNNNVDITLTAEDNSGNIKTQTISMKIDITVPVIEVKYDNNSSLKEKYFKASRRAIISINELNFNSADIRIVVKKDGVLQNQLVPSTNSWSRNGDVNTSSINYDMDGDYTFDIEYTDLAGNSAIKFAQHTFVIDKTLPKIAVAYDNNSVSNVNYYKNSRTATLTIDEVNFNAIEVKAVVTVTENGQPVATPTIGNWSDGPNDTHIAVIKFTADAKYSINIEYKDIAGNSASKFETQTFFVDQTKPTLSISEVKDLSANKDPIAPMITYSDKNIDISKVQIVLNGNLAGNVAAKGVKKDIPNGSTLKLDKLDVDDNYVLTVIITDKSGNITKQSVSFSVNQNGATFIFNQKKTVEGKYVNTPFKPSIKVYDVDEVSIISFSLNGKNVDYDFKNGTISLNEEINKDNKYIIALDVKDTAGNTTSMKPIEFFFDSTKPQNIISGVKDGEIYFDTLDVVIKQENSKDKVKNLVLNGENLKESNYIKNADGSVKLTLTGFKKYTLAVESIDEAGNISDYNETKFEISNNLFVKFYATKPLFYGTLVATGLVILGFIVFNLFFKKKKVATTESE
ncbi:carboxypeptidase-like regulatory domain-containing protein [Clostridium lacusfryxellense]|uniref:carboxypeptidase-like regulatory domain-containing protein n=1 Tax=Clostridium lacusfryxellense TaxID=205328 RepID=UPI001C0D6103|nr:carboxypeptidase-like regulatory domain-containing protein [Clostridium lacusfryxellense]MBU3112355.1 carboxypeptidase-like regulatory domain-containing protein [Clostridium lacusfryxellense]